MVQKSRFQLTFFYYKKAILYTKIPAQISEWPVLGSYHQILSQVKEQDWAGEKNFELPFSALLLVLEGSETLASSIYSPNS